jgi:thioredoxin 1
MSVEHKDASFYKFDVDKTPELAQELSIKAMPTFLFYKNGEEARKVIGGPKKKITDAFKELNEATE